MLPISPTIQPAAAPVTEPVKRNFTDYDSLISELNIKRENILPTPPPGSPAAMQLQTGAPGSYIPTPETMAEPITPEAAARSGQRIAKTIDQAFGFGASMYAKNDNQEDYKARPGDVQDLADAWSDVAMKYSFKIEESPWINVILLSTFIYTPLARRAITDHRFAVMAEQMEAQRIKQEMELQAVRDRMDKIEAERKDVAA